MADRVMAPCQEEKQTLFLLLVTTSRNLAKQSFNTTYTVVNNGLCEVIHCIYCRQIVHFHCVCLSHRRCLISVKFMKIPKQKFESQLTVINPCTCPLIKPIRARVAWKLY